MQGNIYQALPAVEVDRLVRRAVRTQQAKHPHALNKHVDFDDRCQAVHLRLLTSVYNPLMSAPQTFVYRCAKTEMCDLSRDLRAKKSMTPHLVSWGDFEEHATSPVSEWTIEDLPIRADLRELLLRRFTLGQTLTEAAAASGMTKGQVRRRESVALEAARRCLGGR